MSEYLGMHPCSHVWILLHRRVTYSAIFQLAVTLTSQTCIQPLLDSGVLIYSSLRSRMRISFERPAGLWFRQVSQSLYSLGLHASGLPWLLRKRPHELCSCEETIVWAYMVV